jgi:hypothetical protein
MWFSGDQIRDVITYNNHDRTHKGDIAFLYKGVEVRVECKVLQSHSVRRVPDGYEGAFQCDASDRRRVTLPNGETIETTCLLVGEFDLLAVGIFDFGKRWRYAFAKNQDLPRSKFRKYTEEQRNYLLAGTMPITWPLKAPFHEEPFGLLDQIVKQKLKGPARAR